MEKANKAGDLKNIHIAMMKDRMLMYQGKEQIYGTQGAGRLLTNPETNKKEWINFIWPIKNWEEVNALRKSVGFEHTIEEYAQSLSLDVTKKYTVEEIERLTNE